MEGRRGSPERRKGRGGAATQREGRGGGGGGGPQEGQHGSPEGARGGSPERDLGRGGGEEENVTKMRETTEKNNASEYEGVRLGIGGK